MSFLTKSKIPDFKIYKSSRSVLVSAIEEEIGHFFEIFIDNEEEEEVIGITVKPLTKEVRKVIRDYYRSRHIMFQTEKDKERILYPYNGKFYYIDLIFDDNVTKETVRPNGCKLLTMGKKKDSSFPLTQKAARCILGQFARSLGYILDTKNNILKVKIISKEGQTIHAEICNGEDTYKVLDLPKEDGICQTPGNLAKWILASSRYDSELFLRSEPNKDDEQDAKNDYFTEQTYNVLLRIKVLGSKPTIIDMRDSNLDVKKSLAFEAKVLGEGVVSKIQKICNCIQTNEIKKTKIITGKSLKKMGYSPGPIYKTIMKDVAQMFTDQSKRQDVVGYIKRKYPLDKYGHKKEN